MSLQFWLVLALAATLHFVWFSFGALRYGRFKDSGPWVGYLAAWENLRLHNPLSRRVRVEARIANLRAYICPMHGANHDTLGHVTLADLDDTGKQDRIAREGFISWYWFWLGALKNFAWCLLFTAGIGYVFFRFADFMVLRK